MTASPTTSPRHESSSTWTQRTVEAISDRLGSTTIKRRSFLTRAALIGSALAVDPIGFVFKPRSAFAAVCGDENECDEGWSAFCATINDGANTCPSGSYIAGWWKIDNTTFCSGRARYIVDCNRSPGSSCTCSCADGDCDRRRVCCNNFRYGQCNTQIRGTTEVVCRVVICTPPWEWGNCTTTSLTSNGTRTHWSSRLPSRTDPTPINVRWLEMGLTGSVLGDKVGSEQSAPGGGHWARFDRGVMTQRGDNGVTRVLVGPHATAYRQLDAASGPLRYPYDEVTRGVPARVDYQNGATYRVSDSRAIGVWGSVQDVYEDQGGPSGWMGPPAADHVVDGPWDWVQTTSTWYVAHSAAADRTRSLRSVGGLASNGSWPSTVEIQRWSGSNRYETAVEISRRTYPGGAPAVLVVRADDFPDATSAGAVSARLGAPILLTARTELPASTRAEIQRLGAARAIVLGGNEAIRPDVVTALEGVVGEVERWAGANRVETSVQVSQNVFPDGSDWVVLASGQTFPDALTIAPRAHELGAPVLLVQRDRLPDAVREEVRRLGASRVVIAGGTDAVRDRVGQQLTSSVPGTSVRRFAGDSRYETSAAIARTMDAVTDRLVITTGRDFPDGLAVSGWASHQGAPILLADEGIYNRVDAEILRRAPKRIIIIGGESAISRDLAIQLAGYRT